MNALVEDKKTYAQLKKDPTDKYRAQLIKLLQKIEKNISYQLYKQLYPSGGHTPTHLWVTQNT